MKSIRWKLVIIYVAMIFIVLILAGTFIILSYRSQQENKAERDLKQYAATIRENIIGEYEEPGLFQTGFDSPTFGISKGEFQGNILDAEGTTIASNSTGGDGIFPKYQSTAIISAQHGEECFIAGRKHPDANDIFTIWMEYAVPVRNSISSEVEYIIYVRVNADSIYSSISETTNTFILAILIALVLTGILGVVFSGTLTGPISILSSKARELAAGNLDQEIPVSSKDEIGQLTESFNYMASELKKTISEMESEKNKTEIVLYNMTDGVLAYDSGGKLTHANQVSEELLGAENVTGKTFDEIASLLFPSAGLSVSNPGSFRESTLTIGEKYISVSLTSHKNAAGVLEGIVIVLQDITKHKKLDDMRKEFVANVSHEMRTPLTNIKSYAETLMDGAIDDKNVAMDFLGVIAGEVDRMTHIVKDLLELSSLDNKQLVLDIRPTNICDIIRETIKQHMLIAKKQNKDIYFEEPGDNVMINADRQRISQVLTNIINNSVKYSYDGATIEIWIEQSLYYIRVFVRDNGMGIPKDDLRNIFERFYRVDKARSRALGGTGLGLAIAKEIMEAHGGGISAVSEFGKGTTMILRFPNKTEVKNLNDESEDF